jgi:hypothetical protein
MEKQKGSPLPRSGIAKFKFELTKFFVVAGLMVLLLVIFEGLSFLVVKMGWDYVKIIAGTLTACGLYLIASGIKFPPAAEGRRVRYNPPAIVIGSSLTCGAVLYYVSRSFGWIPFCLILTMVIGAVRAGLKQKKK